VSDLRQAHNLSFFPILAVNPRRAFDFFDVAGAGSGAEHPLAQLAAVQDASGETGAAKRSNHDHRSVARSFRRNPEGKLSQWNSRWMGLCNFNFNSSLWDREHLQLYLLSMTANNFRLSTVTAALYRTQLPDRRN
jgi:hypothetical protein